jgi:hypothetical protein
MTMRKVLFVSFLAAASFGSFRLGRGNVKTRVEVPARVEACRPWESPNDPCACMCCFSCDYWGSSCEGCSGG